MRDSGEFPDGSGEEKCFSPDSTGSTGRCEKPSEKSIHSMTRSENSMDLEDMENQILSGEMLEMEMEELLETLMADPYALLGTELDGYYEECIRLTAHPSDSVLDDDEEDEVE